MFTEGIGIALDRAGNRMWVTDLAGSIYLANLDGAGHRQILTAQGNLTGISYAELPAELSVERLRPYSPADTARRQRRLAS